MSDERTNCSPETCQYHMVTEKVVGNLEIAVQEIVRSQSEMRENIIKLTEAVKSFQQMQERIDKLEEKLENRNREQDCEIKENTKLLYKVMGGVAVVSILAATLIPVFMTQIIN